MKPEFEKICDGIYRLCVPFDGNIYTTVFALVCEQGSIIVDSGSNEFDAINYVIPAIKKLGINPDWFICTHLHGDHDGGLKTLLKEYPDANLGGFFETRYIGYKEARVFEDGIEIFSRFKMFNLKGHSDDGLAIYDKKTKILICGDALQQLGLTHFGTSISNLILYKLTIKKVKELNPKVIISSHDYEPFGYYVNGTDKVTEMLLLCNDAVDKIRNFEEENINLTSELLSKAYKEQFPHLPDVPPNTFDAIKSSRSKFYESDFS